MASIEPGKEQLKLIEVIDTKGKGILSGILGPSRTFSVADGFSIEVFRREKNGERHIGSILSKNALVASEIKNSCESMGIRNDDLLLCVSLGGKLITMTGTFTTNDQYQPGYKIVLELAVVNPKQFALRHRQQDDPIGIALAALEGEIRLYGSLRNYDKLKRDDLRYRIGHTLNTGNNKDIGLDVVRVHNVEILMDPHKQEELKAKREAQVETTKVIETGKVDAIKAQVEQWRKASDAQFTREEHAKDREVKTQDLDEEPLQDLLNAAAEEMKQALLQRIREERESGVSFTEILTTHPELQGIYGPPPLVRHRPDISPPKPSDFLGPAERVSLPQPQLRHLHARLPERVRVGDRIPLQVRVALSRAQDRSTPLRAFSIPSEGADLKLVLDSPGFLLHSASVATVHVAPTADSDWVLFELEAIHDGVYTLELSAFNEGAFLGTLYLQLTIDSLTVRENSVDHITLLPLRSPQEGEVTLVIHYDPLSTVYRYQFRGTTFGETDELYSGPLQRKQEDAVSDLVSLLNGQARDLTGYSTEETRRWLQGKGIELWKELIPKELENLFWQQRENIKWMTILSDGDPMPWEVMYPTNDAGDDAGFLVEQFPIVRWIFGPAPTAQLQCSLPCFVVPDDAPLTAEDELIALRRIMGEGQNINDLTPLLKLLDNAEFDALHFACHNIFRADSPTSSSIQLGSKRFVPTFLNKYNRHFHSPLVFMNACRSDGMAANYTWLAGWAKSFLSAGAGAFIGSLWEVRDSSASQFAETFYHALHSGIPLGDAMKQARKAIQNEPGDPTWLAYTLYGNPAATLVKETPKLG